MLHISNKITKISQLFFVSILNLFYLTNHFWFIRDTWILFNVISRKNCSLVPNFFCNVNFTHRVLKTLESHGGSITK